MPESQNIEYKESWRDEYIKWVCGFANAQGGKIFIGVDDKGHVVGLQNAKKLMEDIPNKIRDALGLLVEYHYRTGSTKQLLQGTALTQFLLNKTGTKWDAIPVDCVDFRDLDKESFGIFRREAKKSGRMTAQDLSMTDEELLDSLNLVVDGKLTRAAILLFHRRPERWFGGALPKDSMREAVYNALMHSNYSSGVPIQIRIHKDEVLISNDCVFPANWTAETLMRRHRSEQYNPRIANAFFRAGYVEAWGRGIENMCKLCKDYGVKTEYTVHPGDVMLAFFAKAEAPMENVTEKTTKKTAEKILRLLREKPSLTNKELAEKCGITEDGVYYQTKKMKSKGILRRIGGDKGGLWEIL